MSTKKQVVKRDSNGRWLPGESPNPKGRPANAEKISKLLEPHGENLIKKAVDLALEGDTTALKICLDRMAPSLKPKFGKVNIPEFDTAMSIVEKSNLIMNSVAEGKISIDEGKYFISLIADYIKIVEFADLDERILKLEQAHKKEPAR